MKKNILTLLLLVVAIANLVLTAVMMFTVVPAMQKMNTLVTDICSVLDLELTSGENKATVDLKDLDFYDIDEDITVKFMPGEDGKDHYAVLKVSISMDTTNGDYKTYGADIATKSSLIKNAVLDVISTYTYESAQGKTEDMQDKILEKVQEAFGSDFIYQVIFSDVTFA